MSEPISQNPALNRTFAGNAIDALSNDHPPRGPSCCLGGRLCQGLRAFFKQMQEGASPAVPRGEVRLGRLISHLCASG